MRLGRSVYGVPLVQCVDGLGVWLLLSELFNADAGSVQLQPSLLVPVLMVSDEFPSYLEMAGFHKFHVNHEASITSMQSHFTLLS